MVNIRTPWEFQDLVNELDLLTRDAEWTFGGLSIGSDATAGRLEIHDDSATLMVDLPGVDKDSLSVELEDLQLVVEASRSDLHQDQEEVVLRERTTGEVSRTYTLPWAVDQERVRATFKNGVLSVELHRAPETKPRRIEINNA